MSIDLFALTPMPWNLKEVLEVKNGLQIISIMQKWGIIKVFGAIF